MNLYKYKCKHPECKVIEKGIRICKECGMMIITDRGVDTKITGDWESK